jgi:flagellar FliL protein
MSAVIADPGVEVAPLPRGTKKLLIMIAAGLALVLALGGGVVYYLKLRAAHAAAAALDDENAPEHASAPKIDPKNAPIYLPLDPFVVNLADKDADRYAQIGITLELDTGVSGEQIKAYMPAIRNSILMVLANKTGRELMSREGKEQLAAEIMREAVRPMGIEVAAPEPIMPAPMEMAASAPLLANAASAAGAASVPAAASAAMASGSAASMHAVADAASAKPKAAKRRLDGQRNPIQHVHFSSFIIQ